MQTDCNPSKEFIYNLKQSFFIILSIDTLMCTFFLNRQELNLKKKHYFIICLECYLECKYAINGICVKCKNTVRN